MTLGRPKKTTRSYQVQIKLTLDEEQDRDVIEYLQGLPPNQRAKSIVAVLRGSQNGVQSKPFEGDEDLKDALSFLLF